MVLGSVLTPSLHFVLKTVSLLYLRSGSTCTPNMHACDACSNLAFVRISCMQIAWMRSIRIYVTTNTRARSGGRCAATVKAPHIPRTNQKRSVRQLLLLFAISPKPPDIINDVMLRFASVRCRCVCECVRESSVCLCVCPVSKIAVAMHLIEINGLIIPVCRCGCRISISMFLVVGRWTSPYALSHHIVHEKCVLL